MRKTWERVGHRIYRGGVLVARIWKLKTGYRWRGLGLEREGFTGPRAFDEILADVKYFWSVRDRLDVPGVRR